MNVMAVETQQYKMEPSVVVSAQEKWGTSDHYTREQMLKSIGDSTSFAVRAWKKLPHITKLNLSNRWTKGSSNGING